MLDLYNVRQFLRQYYPSHREGIGREVIFQWDPSLLKNGERRTSEAMQGLNPAPEDVIRSITKIRTCPMRSFVAGYYVLFQGYWANTQASLNDTGGTSRTIPANLASTSVVSSKAFDIAEAAGSSLYGVVVGSNNTAVVRTNTALNTLIAHGATASTLTYGATSAAVPSNPSGTITRVVVSRTFTGNAGSTVNIQEDGIYFRQSTNNWYFLMERNINSFGGVSAAQNVTATKNIDYTT